MQPQPKPSKNQQLPRLTQVWHRSQDYTKKHDFESAYRLILTEGDDMYLLRLLVQTGPVTKFLQAETSK